MTTQAAPRKHSESRRLQTVAGTRVSRDEMEQLRAVAQSEGQSVSNYLRTLVQRAIQSA